MRRIYAGLLGRRDVVLRLEIKFNRAKLPAHTPLRPLAQRVPVVRCRKLGRHAKNARPLCAATFRQFQANQPKLAKPLPSIKYRHDGVNNGLPSTHRKNLRLDLRRLLNRICWNQKKELFMAKCDYCGATIIMGGVRTGHQRFCNKNCYQNACVLSVTKNVPRDQLERKVEEVWRGNCPKCRGLGPIDVHKVHEVWSALVLTRWTTKAQVSCQSCATKRQLGGAAFSFVFGWWGFPWGLVLTPVQITRNIIGMSRGPDPSRPSESLKKLILVNLGTQMIANQKAASRPPPLPQK
jgi:hypothetical protein